MNDCTKLMEKTNPQSVIATFTIQHVRTDKELINMLHKYVRCYDIIIFNINLADDNGMRLKQTKLNNMLCTTIIYVSMQLKDIILVI